MDKISFSSNWNGKLNEEVPYFTTVRLFNTNKYKIGKQFAIYYKTDLLYIATCMSIKILTINQVNEYVAGLDAGLTVKEFIALMMKFYPKIDWKTQRLHLILLKKEPADTLLDEDDMLTQIHRQQMHKE